MESNLTSIGVQWPNPLAKSFLWNVSPYLGLILYIGNIKFIANSIHFFGHPTSPNIRMLPNLKSDEEYQDNKTKYNGVVIGPLACIDKRFKTIQ